jgi:transposase-like protein
MQKRKTFTREFKIEAVRLLKRKEKPAADLARELGLKRNMLYKWQEEMDGAGEETPFPGRGRPKHSETHAAENAQLKRELAKLKEENEILKKAAAFFARELK